ncbi:DUF397 domain-containing protein [Streptomyces sp. NPDC093544]|uniref:DUF397 domain-containing protein n=1 Tax=Streptomyces sp. NPDC093544 TaxID=3155200 RepID=UPI003448DA7B
MGGSWSWRKSSVSGGGGNDCVEIAWTGEAVLVRDSRVPRGVVLVFDPVAWRTFLTSVPPKSSSASAEPTARP